MSSSDGLEVVHGSKASDPGVRHPENVMSAPPQAPGIIDEDLLPAIMVAYGETGISGLWVISFVVLATQSIRELLWKRIARVFAVERVPHISRNE